MMKDKPTNTHKLIYDRNDANEYYVLCENRLQLIIYSHNVIYRYLFKLSGIIATMASARSVHIHMNHFIRSQTPRVFF